MLNEAFKERMQNLLGEEYDKFIEALENGEPIKGLRVNTIKSSCEHFLSVSDFSLEKLPYLDEGFILLDKESVGESPEHHAGMIYMQDPGAMATLCALDIKEGAWVIDLCSAPGGKSSQAAAKIGKSGFILSNEYVPKRAKITVSNFERLGITNAIVTSLDTKEFKKLFCACFDLVIADVPCSGEGMFRKSDAAIEQWSEANVLACAERQREILENAAGLVKPGGYILYSTCTYSTEENEEVILDFISKHSDYEIYSVKEELEKKTKNGLPFNGEDELKKTRRFYPHVSKGEGQFIALLKRKEDIGDMPTILYKDSAKAPTREESAILEKFFKENLISRPEGRAVKAGENLVLISHDCPLPQRSVFSAGVLIGEIRSGMLFPSHQFFSAYGKLFKRIENLTKNDERTKKYLRGEVIDGEMKNGWCLVCVDGLPLGLGKAVNGSVKNHLPKGLRMVK